ncbi:MAG: DUF1707 domain-containing protein [Solirubrobacteraceae bacterium]
MCHPVRYQRFERDLRERESFAPDLPAGDLRASDADRERAVEQLRVHATAGRLTVDEFEQRLERVYAARTGRELRAELSDLPAERTHRRRLRRPAGPVPFPLVALLIVAAGAVTGAWWLLWLIWPAAMVLGRGAHHAHRRLRA